VFVVPRAGDGQIAINGSLPGRVLRPGEELVLTFQGGRLAGITPEDCPAARHLRETQIAFAERRRDPNWTNLAEIGFGLNPTVPDLCGISTVDEKKAHTLHIALGHSLSLGGDVDSVIHCDMIIRKPTVYVSGRLIMKKGDWRINEADWRLDHRNVADARRLVGQRHTLGRSGVRTERENGRLVCAWNAGQGRWDSTPIGLEGTARLAARVYDLLPRYWQPGGKGPRDAGSFPERRTRGGGGRPALGDAPVRPGARRRGPSRCCSCARPIDGGKHNDRSQDPVATVHAGLPPVLDGTLNIRSSCARKCSALRSVSSRSLRLEAALFRPDAGHLVKEADLASMTARELAQSLAEVVRAHSLGGAQP
jgi:hypothetical protein